MTVEILGVKHERFVFGGGEVHVRINTIDFQISSHKDMIVCAHLKNSEDVMELMLVCDALKRLDIVGLKLVIYYFPYARRTRSNSVEDVAKRSTKNSVKRAPKK